MLCLTDLADLIHGRVHFDSMPPVRGDWTPIGRIALDCRQVEPGELFWRLPSAPWQSAGSGQYALMRGASGIVVPPAEVAAWPGTFCLEVENPAGALIRLLEWLQSHGQPAIPGRVGAAEKNQPELKVLQLCRYQGLANTPPTCGRAGRESAGSCHRRAA